MFEPRPEADPPEHADSRARSGLDPVLVHLTVALAAPALLAMTSVFPDVMRMVLIMCYALALGIGWPILTRFVLDWATTVIITVVGVVSATVVLLTGDYGKTLPVIAFTVLAAFIAQMLRRGGRAGLLENVSVTVAGAVVVESGAAWGAFMAPTADPSVVVPTCVALFIGACLNLMQIGDRHRVALTVTMTTLAAGAAGVGLAFAGFFGVEHAQLVVGVQTGIACLVIGFVVGLLMSVSDRLIEPHRWARTAWGAIAAALLPVVAIGAPAYALARVMGTFIAR